MKYELLIFDWDGTLVDSAGQIVAAMQAAIRDLDLPPRSDRQIAELIGLGMDDVLRRLFPELEPTGVRALLTNYRKTWLANAQREADLFAGVQDAVAELSRRGLRLAVATGKTRRGLDRSFRAHAALAGLIGHSRCADETASKPHPMMLEELLDETGVDPASALMIGDTEYDVAMARSIGVTAVGVSCGVHEPGRLHQAGADAVIASVAALPDWLRSG